MNQGKSYCCGAQGIAAFLLLVCALPAVSSTEDSADRAPEPNASQRALIEAHGTTNVGWWSSATREIDEPAAVDDEAPRSRTDAKLIARN